MPPAAPAEEKLSHLVDVKFSRRQIIAVSIAAGLLLILAGIGIFGLLTGPPERPADPPTPSVTPDAPGEGQDVSGGPLPPIVTTSDPETFARSVAVALFEWDTTTIASPEAILAHLMEVAEPGGTEAHGLYQDVRGYLPTAAQWRQLREYDTRQLLSIHALFVPESWEQIVTDPANGIAEGIFAVTIDGTRIRKGGWRGQEAVKEYPVTFTLFLSCPPDSDQCFLLRLSALDRSLR